MVRHLAPVLNFSPYCYPEMCSFFQETLFPASDVWSFAILCCEVISEEMPHKNADLLDIALKIRDQGHHPPVPENMPAWLVEVCNRCWQYDPAGRLSMKEVVDAFNNYERFGMQTPQKVENAAEASGESSSEEEKPQEENVNPEEEEQEEEEEEEEEEEADESEGDEEQENEKE
eukprot:TRINITY_DN2214_c1_g1_i1.p1 TRINITY_DN2214_c1_g1~~TRINITY_DN2214_c1_g1_i1.p1  ORF type:complete len:174 (+),score=37.61 TRINITY_DN2214_c1_g1_i1:103-624(+)